MRFAVFVGCVGIVFSATMADASGLRACTRAEIQEALSNPEKVLMDGVVPGRDCEVTPESLADPLRKPQLARLDIEGSLRRPFSAQWLYNPPQRSRRAGSNVHGEERFEAAGASR